MDIHSKYPKSMAVVVIYGFRPTYSRQRLSTISFYCLAVNNVMCRCWASIMRHWLVISISWGTDNLRSLQFSIIFLHIHNFLLLSGCWWSCTVPDFCLRSLFHNFLSSPIEIGHQELDSLYQGNVQHRFYTRTNVFHTPPGSQSIQLSLTSSSERYD